MAASYALIIKHFINHQMTPQSVMVEMRIVQKPTATKVDLLYRIEKSQ